MGLIFQYLMFGFVALFLWCIPGLYIVDNKNGFFQRLVMSTLVGFSLYSLVVWSFSLLNWPHEVLTPIFILSSIVWLSRNFSGISGFKLNQISRSKIMLFALVAIGVIIQGQVLIRSGVYTDQGLRFLELSAHDSLQHIYLINELKWKFPPRHPGFAPDLVQNYHFLLDLVLASIMKIFSFTTLDLYYRVVPAFVSILLSFSVFAFVEKLTKSKWYANAGVFLTLFAGNASYIVGLFRGQDFDPAANNFMLDPIIDLMQNPIAVIVFPLMLAGISLLQELEKESSLRLSLSAGLLFGVMVGFKAWGGALMLLSLPLYALWLTLKRKNYSGWLVLVITILVELIILLPNYDSSSAANPVFAPGWLLDRMVEDPDRLNLPEHYFLRQSLIENKNYLRLAYLRFKEMLFYLGGNLWVRILGIYYLVCFFGKKRASDVFMISTAVLSLGLPLVFNQGKMAYDIVQFGPYALILFSIFTIKALEDLGRKLKPGAATLIAITVLLSSIPSNFSSISGRFRSESFLVDNQALEAYAFVKQETDKDSVLMVFPSERNDAILLAAALSQRPTYFSGKSFARISGFDWEKRRKKWREFFRNTDPVRRREIIKEGSIDYLFLTREQDENFVKSGLNLKEVFSNKQVVLYKVVV